VHGYLAYSLAGVSDFGFPNKWLKVKLTGKASELKRIKSKYAGQWFVFLVFSLVLLLVLVVLFVFKIYKLKQIPTKTEHYLSPLLDFVINKPVDGSEGKGDSELFSKARCYLMSNLDKSTKPEALAQELGVSLRQLQRVFRDGLDTTPNTFIILIKLEAAAEMLKQNNLNISEVAYSVGFNDPSYFSRVFKKYFNISPSEMTISTNNK
jgi:AraC-like DNA-binding protein